MLRDVQATPFTRSFTASLLVKSEVECPAFAASLIGCVESMRSQPIAHPHNFTDDLTSPTSHCRHTAPLHSAATTAITAIMSDNENGDDMVTKPFKFVTGMLPRPARTASLTHTDKLTSPQLVRRPSQAPAPPRTCTAASHGPSPPPLRLPTAI